MNKLSSHFKITFLSAITLIFLSGSLTVGFAKPRNNQSGNLDRFPVETVSQSEIEGLKLMREEEKLARDVYLALYKKWGLRIFTNISQSEESHMSRVKELLDRYQIADPVVSNAVGEFSNPELRQLYLTLVEKGSASIEQALATGAMIEDLDIRDLNELLKETDNQDIQFVYGNLKRGSINHIQSFYQQIKRNGNDYQPQYISQAEFDQIISSNISKGAGGRK